MKEHTYEEKEFIDTVRKLLSCRKAVCEEFVEISICEFSESESLYDLLKWEIPGALADLIEETGWSVEEYYFRSVEQPYPDYLFVLSRGNEKRTLGVYIDVDYEAGLITIQRMEIMRGVPSESMLAYYV